jgi:hypothetical protein
MSVSDFAFCIMQCHFYMSAVLLNTLVGFAGYGSCIYVARYFFLLSLASVNS